MASYWQVYQPVLTIVANDGNPITTEVTITLFLDESLPNISAQITEALT
jgi:hypothetical protein